MASPLLLPIKVVCSFWDPELVGKQDQSLARQEHFVGRPLHPQP